MASVSLKTVPEDILDHIADGVYFVDVHRRITSWNKAAERISGFGLDEVRGRCCAEGILTHVDDKGFSLCKNDCPLSRTLKDGQQHEGILNLHHKSGHRVPVQVSVNPVRNDKGEIIGAVETFRECSDVIALRSSIEHLKRLGCVDVTSGLPNRRIAQGHLAQRFQEMQRFGWKFSVMLVEIDFLKELRLIMAEDGVGEAIRMAALCVQNSLRAADMTALWDEATFIGIIANTTAAELSSISERVRMMVDSAYRLKGDAEIHVTVSIGAVAADDRDNAETIIVKAQRCLYESRSGGRNRVTVSGVAAEGG